MELINYFDHNALKEQIQNAKHFPHFCIDNFLDEDFANAIAESFPSYQEAQKLGREFSAVNEKKKIQVSDSSKFPAPIAKLNEIMASKEFMDTFSDLFGIPNLLADVDLAGGGIHETNAGGRLDVHVDFNYIEKKQWHRRLNLLIYFNKDWKEEYGGYLDLWDEEVQHCHGSFAPVFNRICGFATSNISYHGVTPINCPAGVARKSFATYYYTTEAPAHWNGTVHSTIFKARPDEWTRGNILMPAEATVRATKAGISQAKHAIKSLFGN
jgi:Rps23 Pro-64 3,4-dihydroxylase Tpa1-like proline 4-hydroxylase